MYGVIHYDILDEFNVNHIDYLVAYHIMVMSKNGGFCSKSIPTIAKDIRTSKDTVKRALKKIDNKLVVNLGSNTKPMRIVTVNFIDSVKKHQKQSVQIAPIHESILHPSRGQNAPIEQNQSVQNAPIHEGKMHPLRGQNALKNEGKMHSLKVIKVNKSNKESSEGENSPTPVPNYNEIKKGVLKKFLENCDPKFWQDAFRSAEKIPPTTKKLVEEVEQWEARCKNLVSKQWVLKAEVDAQWRDFKNNWIPNYNSKKAKSSPTNGALPRVFTEEMYSSGEYNQKFYQNKNR